MELTQVTEEQLAAVRNLQQYDYEVILEIPTEDFNNISQNWILNDNPGIIIYIVISISFYYTYIYTYTHMYIHTGADLLRHRQGPWPLQKKKKLNT